MKKLPEEVKPGDKIYVGSSYYLSHGCDDFSGGLATVKKVLYRPIPQNPRNEWMVVIEERPGWESNLTVLLEEQEKLAKEYEGKIAHKDPDTSPEFNTGF